jgi:hypothetical protein
MKGKFVCRCCGKCFTRNHRIKNQQYCNSPACQQARKNQWEREKIKKDADYRKKRKEQKTSWYKRNHGNIYQHGYRERNKEYRSKNSRDQNQRNRARNKKIVKTDALLAANPIQQGLYAIIAYGKIDAEMIVKTDAKIVEILEYQVVQT